MQSFIADFVAENCRGERFLAERLERFVMFRQLAIMAADGNDVRAGGRAADDSDVDTALGAAEEVRFYFASAIGTDDDKAWFVELTVPARATVGTMLKIKVGDRVRHPLSAGEIEISGRTIPFANGVAEISYEEFLAGIRDSHIVVRRDGTPDAVPGRLLFF